MDAAAFDKLNAMGDFARERFARAFTDCGIAAQVTGQGSLLRIHLTGRELRDYRTVYPTSEESAHMASVHQYLLAAGFFISSYGMVCLSTENTEAEVLGLIDACVNGITAYAN